MRTVRWGIIGCGDVTERKSGPGFQKATGSALVAVMRRDAAKAEDYARRHNVPRWYGDADALIADAEVDAVYVATMPDTHELYACKVAAAGKPCYVEKPFARNATETERMAAAFAAKGLPLYVAYYRRGLPPFRKAKELLETGAIGILQSVIYRFSNGQLKRTVHPADSKPWRLDPEVAGGGLFLDLGSHALDALDFILGPLNFVSGSAHNHSGLSPLIEDTAHLSFTTPGGVPGAAEWSFAADAGLDEFRFIGSKGEFRFACFNDRPLVLQKADGSREETSVAYPPHVQQPLIQMMVDELNGVPGAPPVPSTAASAIRTQLLMDQVTANFYQGREDGFWNRTTRGS